MADTLDQELILLLNRLNKVQNEVGGKKDKHGRGKGSANSDNSKIDRFIDLTERMKMRLDTIALAIDDIHRLEKAPGSNPTDLISNQSKVRIELSSLSEEWKDLDTIYRLEARKKRSRYSPDELAARQQMVVQMQQSIQNIKDQQRSGFVKGYNSKRMVTMEESELFKPRDIEMGGKVGPGGPSGAPRTQQARGVTGQKYNNMTDQQRTQLMVIKERDQQVDMEIEEIGKGLDILKELALQANEEIKIQNNMLDTLEEKVNNVGDKVLNINQKMKETLEKARSSDKICMDIVCLLILVGMIIVLVKVNEQNSKK